MALALMFVDLDGLKKVNDRFGHERGDSVLISAAAILAAAVRDGDAVGRIGGDEFALCMVAPRRQANVSAQHIADRVIDSVKTIGAGVGCSIGIVLAVDAKIDIAVAMAHADAAMYTAKRDGGNRYRISEELL
jgi:diguanylate cyclase (GGDEF)-like protein